MKGQKQSRDEAKRSKRWRKVQQLSGRKRREGKNPPKQTTVPWLLQNARKQMQNDRMVWGLKPRPEHAASNASDTVTTRLWTNVDSNQRGKLHSDRRVDIQRFHFTKTNNPLGLLSVVEVGDGEYKESVWHLRVTGWTVATLIMDVQEDGGNYTRFNEDVQLHFCLKANRGWFSFFFCGFWPSPYSATTSSDPGEQKVSELLPQENSSFVSFVMRVNLLKSFICVGKTTPLHHIPMWILANALVSQHVWYLL